MKYLYFLTFQWLEMFLYLPWLQNALPYKRPSTLIARPKCMRTTVKLMVPNLSRSGDSISTWYNIRELWKTVSCIRRDTKHCTASRTMNIDPLLSCLGNRTILCTINNTTMCSTSSFCTAAVDISYYKHFHGVGGWGALFKSSPPSVSVQHHLWFQIKTRVVNSLIWNESSGKCKPVTKAYCVWTKGRREAIIQKLT